MSGVEVPGARLHVEIEGSGPLLVLVPGAAGVAAVFARLARHLAGRFTVLRYDRRGFGRSELTTATPTDRMAADADDVAQLVEHAGADPAIVFGSSSGAIVALTALIKHPQAVATVVAHEPPLLRLLAEGDRWIGFFHDTYEVFQRAGTEPALAAFQDRTFPPADRDAMAHAPKHPGNAAFWFEHELRQYPAADLDLDALRRQAGRIVPAAGQASGGYPCQQASAALAATLGRSLAQLPGGHIGFLTDTAAFADHLRGVLADDAAAKTQPSIAHARVPTARAARYLEQFCRHAEQVHRIDHSGAKPDEPAAPPRRVTVHRDGPRATLQFDGARCTLNARADALILHIEADNPDILRRVQALLAADLSRFAHREQPPVLWQPGNPPP